MKCNKRGFTLIELLVVVLIIGILAAVAVPQYQVAVWKSRYATIKNMVKSIAQAEEVYYLANGTYSLNFDELDIDLPNKSNCSTVDYQTTCNFADKSCTIAHDSQASTVTCTLLKNNTAFLDYAQRLQHTATNDGGLQICRAYSKDLNDISNKICKNESNRSKGLESDTYMGWTYK